VTIADPTIAAPETSDAGLSFGPFDERFLEKSWFWLNDPIIKHHTMTPDFTREQQQHWFNALPTMRNYWIWGVAFHGEPIGAVGLKGIADGSAEYFGYIGERMLWGRGLGRRILAFAQQVAMERGLRHIRLKVHPTNEAALRLYKGGGFSFTGERGPDEVLWMSKALPARP
jgi:RimJ/RimL family protein N-acetyltransferase